MDGGLTGCATIDAALVAFQLGELAEVEGERVEAHLAACPACLEVYFEVKRASDAAQGQGAAPHPRVERELARIVAARRIRTPQAFALACAAMLLLAVAVSLLLRVAGPHRDETPERRAVHVDDAGHRSTYVL